MNRPVCLLLLISSGLFAASVPAPAPEAARLYRVKCAVCHGVTGEGGTGASLKGKLQHPTSKAMFDVIKHGVPGTAMPASTLGDPEIKKLVVYVQFLNKKQ